MDIKGNKFMVIGGAGFIGSYIVELLIREGAKQVIVYDNLCRGKIVNIRTVLDNPAFKMVEADIRSIGYLNYFMDGMDGVFHLAALWLGECQDNPRAAFETNIAGTFNVFSACVENKVKRLVFSSSASVYGDAIEEPMTEKHPYNNWSFYGATKISGEQLFRAMYNRDSLYGVGLRYMNVYGPRMDYKGTYTSVIMKMLDRIEKNLSPVIYGDGTESYDFVYVKDVAKANICAMKSKVPFDFYNIGTGIKTSLNNLARILLDINESKLPILYEPKDTLVRNRVGSTEKAEYDLGFCYETSVSEGLEETVVWKNSLRN